MSDQTFIRLLNTGQTTGRREKTFLDVGVGLRLRVVEQQLREVTWMVKLTKSNPYTKSHVDKYQELADLVNKYTGQLLYQLAEMNDILRDGIVRNTVKPVRGSEDPLDQRPVGGMRDHELQEEVEETDDYEAAVVATQSAQNQHHITQQAAEDIDLDSAQSFWDNYPFSK